MKNLLLLARGEPAAIGGLVSVLIALAVSFGLHLSSGQVGAITAAVSAVVAVVVRSSVTPELVAPLPKVPPGAPIPPAP